MMKLVLASGNAGKVDELQAMLNGLDIEVIPQSQFDVPEAEETGLTFVENAIIKARNAAKFTKLPALGDDSGLEVDALQGAPGIYSSRYAGDTAIDLDNNQKLLTELQGMDPTKRTARFQCVIAYLRHESDPTPLIVQGTWEGSILEAPQGTQGFGYDPLFWLPSEQCTAAELDKATKNRLSHRGQALAALKTLLLKSGDA